MTTTSELMSTIEVMSENGCTKAKIEGFLMYEHDYTVNKSKELVQKVLGKSTTNGSDWSATIEYIRENFGKIDKKELITGMCEIKNAKYSSMNHAYNYIRFAQEYAAQEVAKVTK